MRRLILIASVLLAGGFLGGAVLAGCATTTAKEGAASLPTLAEKVRKGEIDVGKAYGLALEQRFHRIHAEVVGLECATCHVEKLPASATVFTLRPAVDASPDSPDLIDRRACLGCHTAGPGRDAYAPRRP